jgi:hypothetical protein
MAPIYTALLALLVLAQCGLSARVTNPKKVPKKAVLLSKVNSRTVRAGQKTASRRVSPVPQLQCVGRRDVCELYQVDVMRCTNEGSDYDAENIQWACKASLPDEFKLGSTDVSCEGYESREDPYVLKGSCGVESKLLLTEQGEAKYGKQNDYSWQKGTNSSERYAGYLFMAVFLVVLSIILRSLYRAWQSDDRRGGGRRPGAGGWGGGPGDDDPPPPYDDSDYRPPKKRAYTTRTSTGTRASSSRSTGGNQQQGWRPGFWTGTAAGAAAGYLAGNRNQARTQPETMERRPGGGLFGGGNSWTRQPPPSPSSSTPSFSSSRHESTGFGSTSRR